MVNSQEWLDNNYPLEKRKEIRELKINSKCLSGSLNLNDFINLECLGCWNNFLANLTITNCSKLEKIDCSENDFSALEISNCPSLKWLECSNNKQLTTLTVVNNSCLTELYCSYCRLTTFTISNNPNLAILYCNWNFLKSPSFLTNLNRGSLTSLGIRNSSFGGTKILGQVLSQFANLEKLWLANNSVDDVLKSLQNCNKLKYLEIKNTQITSGLEYLPTGLEEIECDGKLAKKMKDYKKEGYNNNYYYQAWREENKVLVDSLLEYESSLNNLKLALLNQIVNNEIIYKALRVFIFQTEEKIKGLRKELYQEPRLESQTEQLTRS